LRTRNQKKGRGDEIVVKARIVSGVNQGDAVDVSDEKHHTGREHIRGTERFERDDCIPVSCTNQHVLRICNDGARSHIPERPHAVCERAPRRDVLSEAGWFCVVHVILSNRCTQEHKHLVDQRRRWLHGAVPNQQQTATAVLDKVDQNVRIGHWNDNIHIERRHYHHINILKRRCCDRLLHAPQADIHVFGIDERKLSLDPIGGAVQGIPL
jgi:hypothetical protein